MTFNQEFLAALHAGQDYAALLDLAHRHQAQGQAAQDTYQILQEIWLESGFNERDEESALQNNLEAVMEKVWYECPA